MYTFEIEGRGNPETTTVELQREEGSTRVTLTNLCASKEIRDMMGKYGADAGARAALQQLARVVERSGGT